MKFKLPISLILVSIFAFSCDQNPPLPVGSFEDVSQANNDLGFRMMQNLQMEEKDKNIFISPFSISSALAMTANGAQGETQEEMYNALGLSKLTESEVNTQYKSILDALLKSSRGIDFSIANGIFYREGFATESDFLAQAQDNFDGKIEELDFNDPSSKTHINEWVEDQTENRIKDMISNISMDDMMFLINTIYLNGPWTNGFPEVNTNKGEFTLEDGSKDSVDLMFQDAGFPFFESNTYSAASFYLGKDEARFSVDIILPKEIDGLGEVVNSIDFEEYQNLISNLNSPTRLMVTFPKLEIDYEKQLKEPLKSLGMEKAFVEGEADLRGIADVKKLHISRVKHKTFLKIDETGVEAAGSTSVGISVTSVPPQFTINHPFLLIIRDINTSTILFMGKIMNPNG